MPVPLEYGLPPVAAADQLAIQDLVTRYNRAVDRGDVESWVGCFTADGAFQGVLGRQEGHEELRAFATDLATGPGGEPFRPMRHWTTNFVIGHDAGSDTARMRADHILFRQTADAAEPLLMGVYRDRLVRGADGAWRFSERVFELQGGSRA